MEKKLNASNLSKLNSTVDEKSVLLLLRRRAQILLLLIALLMSGMKGWGQTFANYRFSASSSTWSALSGGTSPASLSGTGNDRYANNLPINFNFPFNGTNYTHAHVNENGWLTLGTASGNNVIASGGFTNSFASLPNAPLIAPLWDDLGLVNGATDISYATTGSTPNRIFTLQVNNLRWQTGAASASIAYQVKLYENGKIDFIYNQLAGSLSVSPTASIGIASANSTYFSLDGTGTSPAASTSTNTTNLATRPASGQTYTFTPPPIINGSIASNGEYGTHTDGSNMQTNGGAVTYMTWDNTNLYVGVTGATLSEALVLYLDKDPQVPVDGGTNANGTQGGNAYDGTNFANLPYRADIVMYVKSGYREYRTSNGSNGWSAATSAFGTYAESGTTREFSIPWSVLGGRPTSFNFFSYLTSAGGFVYGQVPTENGSGAIGTTARYARYYTVSVTTPGSSTLPFSRNSYVFNSTSDITSFGSISCFDFTMNTAGRFISRTGSTSGNWTIAGNLVVGNGIIYLGSGGVSYGTTSISGNMDLRGGTFDMDATTGAVSVTGNVTIASGATLSLSNSAGGDLSLSGNWTNNGGTLNNRTRQVTFNGSTAQTLTGNTTFDYLKLNNASGLTLQASSPVTVNTNLDLTNGKLTLGANNLTLGSAASITNATSANYIVTDNTGYLIRNVGNSEVTYPIGTATVYAPAYLTQASTQENLSARVSSTITNAPLGDANAGVALQWTLNEATAGSNNITTKFQWPSASQEGSSFSRTATVQTGRYISSAYTTSSATVAGSAPYTATSSGMTSTISNTPFVVGNDYYFISYPRQFRSITDGNWNTNATWEMSLNGGSTWIPATATPTSADGAITIRSGNTVTVAGGPTVDEVTVASGGTLTLSTSSTLTVANGTGDDLVVFGTLTRPGTSADYLTINASAVVRFMSGGIYRHQQTGSGVIPIATWDQGSTCLIEGLVDGTSLTNLNQSYSNFTWNCSGQTTNPFAFEGNAPTINGIFKVQNTGASGTLILANTSTARSWTTVDSLEVAGGFFYVSAANAGGAATPTISMTVNNLNVTSGTFEIARTNNAGTYSFTVNGNAQFSGGTSRIMNNSGTGGRLATLTVTGNVTVNGGTLDMSASGATNSGRLFIQGNLLLSSGTLLFTQAITTGSSGIYFDGAGTQSFTHSGGTLSTVSGGIGRRFYYKTVSGPTLLNETYSASAAQTTINGSEGTPSSAGNYAAWPTSGNLINDVTINNTAGVTLSTSKEINGILTMSNGSLSIGANTLTLDGTVTGMSIANSFTGSASSNLTIGGTGTLGTLFFDPTTDGGTNLIGTYTQSRGTTSASTVTLGNKLVSGTAFTLTNGLFDLNGQTLVLNGTFSGVGTSNNGTLRGSSASNLTIGGTGALGTLFFDQSSDGTTNQIATYTQSRGTTSASTVTLGNKLVSGTAFTLTNGLFDLNGQTLVLNGTFSGVGTSNNGTLRGSSASNLTIGGTGAFGTLFFDQSSDGTTNQIATYTQSRGTSSASTVTLGNKLVNGTAFTLSNGLFVINGQTLVLNGSFSGVGTSNNGSLQGSSTSNLTVGGTGALGTLFFDQTTPGTTNNIATFTLNRTSSGSATLGNDASVGTSLALTSCLFTLGSSNLTLSSTATISGTPSASNMIVATGSGQLRKIYGTTGSFTFPVGDATGTTEYSPVSVNVTAGSGFSTSTFATATYIGVNLVDAVHPNNASTNHFITRYWNVTQSGITGCTATVTGTYLAADITGTEASIKGAQLNGSFNQSTNPWVKTGGSNLSANTLTYTGASLTSGTASAFTGITSADPTVSITGGGVSVCKDASVTLTANPTGDLGSGWLYSWSGTITGSTTSSTATPTTSTVGGPNTYTVTVKDGNGISSSASAGVTVTIVAQPNITAQPSGATICIGNTFSPTVTAAGGTPSLTYQWQYSSDNSNWNNVANGTPTNATYTNATSASLFSVTGNIAAGTYYYRCVVSASGTGCSSVNSNTATLTITATNTWAGTISTDWNTAGNWSCGYVPTSSTNVVIPSGTTFSPNITSANAVANSVTINASATLTMSNSYTLTITAGGSFTNNGVFNRGNGTVSFAGAGSLSGTITFNNLTLAGTVTFGSAITVDGTLTINSGGAVSSNAPIYTSNSTLLYNTGGVYGRFTEWNATGTGTIGTTAGYPNNVTLSNSTTLNYPNGSPTVARSLEGNLTINSGSSLYMDFGSPGTSGRLTIKGNLTSAGNLTMGDAAGGDIYVGGNWTRTAGTFDPKTRAVFFTGSGTNVINTTGGEAFDYLVSTKTGGSIQLGSTLTINAPNGGNGLSLVTAASLDLNGQTLNLTNSVASTIQVDGGVVSITGSAGSTVAFSNATKTISSISGGSVSFGSNVLVQTATGINFGNSLSTINGTFRINAGGFVSSNSPIYSNTSTLEYNSGTVYGRNLEWNATSGAGYPNNVTISSGTSLDLGANSGTGIARSMAGNLLVSGGLFLDYLTNDMTQPLTVGGNVTISGTLSLSEVSGGDIKLSGNWTNSGTFNPKGRAVFFISTSSNQTITNTSGETFDFLILEKSALTKVVLANNITVNTTLTLTSGSLDLSNKILTLGSSATAVAGSFSASNMIIADGGGEVRKSYSSNPASSVYLFPIGDNTSTAEYSPVTLTFSGTGSGYVSVKVTDAIHPNNANTTNYISRYWTVASSGFTSPTVLVAGTYTDADIVGTEADIAMGRWTGSLPWVRIASSMNTTTNTLSTVSAGAVGDFTGIGQPTISITPTAATICTGNSTTLNTTASGGGTLTYSWSPGGATASSVSVSPTTTTSYTVTISDGNGITNTANQTITVDQLPTTATVGVAQTICGLTSASLGGNVPGVGTGAWSIVSGGTGSFSSASSNTATFTANSYGAYVLRWTISNGTCTASTADITVTYYQNPSTATVTSSVLNFCNTLVSGSLGANNPVVGTGAWSIVSGGTGTFSNATSNASTFTADSYGTYVLRWTISNGNCTPTTVDVTVNYYQPPTTATVTSATLNSCSSLTSAALGGNTPTIGTGTWSQTSGPGSTTFSNASSPSSTATATQYGTYVYRWTISNGSCVASSADVTVNYYAAPSSASVAQTPLNYCGTLTSGSLGGNTPDIGSGTWTQIAGPGSSTFSSSTSASSTVTVTAYGSYQYRWSVSNGPCSSSDADVYVNFYQTPTTANAGPDQTGSATCGATTVTLAANTATVGTGSWSVVSGSGGSFGNASSPASTFSGTSGTTYTLRWTITNGTCAESTDEVVITFNQVATTANAGADQNGAATCGLTSVTLAGNTPTAGTGLWSVVTGSGGTFNNAANPSTDFNGTAGTTYSLQWVITNGVCISRDTVEIKFNQNPTTADAGLDQTGASTCGLTTVTLEGNAPSVGSGVWTIVSGTGGTITTPSSPTSTFSGTAGSTYTLRWTISNSPCTASSDEVNIKFNINPTTANAGPDQVSSATCGNTSVTLAGNAPTTGTGTWSVVNGTGGSFLSASNPTTTFSGTSGETYTLRWTITNGVCSSSDDVTVTFNANPTTANAGNDVSQCGSSTFTMSANSPTAGSGVWSVISGTVSISNNNNPNATVTITSGTSATLRWTISNAPCTASFDDVTISFDPSGAGSWQGTVSSDWNNPANWSCSTLPTSATNVVIAAGAQNNPNISGANATVNSITINSGATLTLSGNYTLTITSGGSFTNNGTVSATNGTVLFAGSGTLNGNSATTFNNLTLGGAVSFATVPTINATLQLNSGGSVLSNAPKYGASSTLLYNNGGSYSRNLEWTAASGTLGTTPGYPNNVFIQNNTTLNIGDASVGTGQANRAMAGDMTINEGSSLTMGTMANTLTIGENVLIYGTLTLSSASGGNLLVGGDWTRSSTGVLNTNTRSVTFNGAVDQTFTSSGGETFEELIVNKAAGNLELASDVSVAQTCTLTSGTLDINTQTLTITGVITKAAGGTLASQPTGTVLYNKATGNQDVIYADYGNLTLQNGNKVLADNLGVAGNFTIQSSTTADSITNIRFNGNNAQSIAGFHKYKNIAISGTGGYTKTFTGDASFIGDMTFTGGAGTVDLDGASNDKLFTIISNASRTANIGNLNSWTISGSPVVERYVGPAKRAWRLLAIPVNGPTIREAMTRLVNGVFPAPWCAGDLSLPTPAAGGGTLLTGHSMSRCENANSIGYDHLINGGNSSIRFYSFVNGSGSLGSATNTPLVNQPATHGGYFVFVRGDRTVTNTGSGVTTMRPKGTINQGDTVVTVDQTYQVVGNPYPAQINLDDIYNNGDNNTAITSNFWVWDSNLGVDGGYRFLSQNFDGINYTVIPEPELGMTDNDYLIVNSGQAFFVERNGATGGPITISEEDKVTGGNGNTPMFRINNQPSARINVRLYRSSGTTLQMLMDGTGARYGDGYSTATNEVYDVYKANQSFENIALNRNLTKYMSIESRPFPDANDTLFVTFYRTTVRDYALRINTRDFEGLNYNVVLLDAFNGSETVIPVNGQDLIYPFKVTSAAASYDYSRFKIVLRTSVVTPVNNLPLVKGIEMYPSLVAKGGTTKLMLTNKQAGAYQLNLYSMLGVRVLSQTIRHGGGTGSYFMELPQQLAAGTYTAEIKGVNGEVKNVKLVIH